MKTILTSTLLMLAVLATWRHALPGGIIFYQGIVVAVVGGVAVFALGLRRGPRMVAFKDGLLALLLIYAFVFTVPTTVDRAYSVRILDRIALAPEGMTREQLAEFVTRDFAAEGGLDRRLREQTRTGTIEESGDRWRLTGRGEAFVQAFGWTCTVFVCQNH